MIGQTNGGNNAYSLALLGDVNNDGLADIAIGSPEEGTGGEVYVVFGKSSGDDVPLSDIAAGTGGFVINGASAGDDFGGSVGAAGDVNGDGLADIIVGTAEPTLGAPSNPDGYAVVVFGKEDTAAVSVASLGSDGFLLTAEAAGDRAGHSVAGLGDLNDDGLSDVAVGAFGNGTAGRAYVVFGRTASTDISLSDVGGSVPGFVINGENAGDEAGEGVGGAGDVNGDGIPDVLVGAPDYNTTDDSSGRAYVVFGKSSNTAVELSAVAGGTGGFAMTGEGENDFAGRYLSGAGDINGDGFADVVVGAFLASSGAGRAYVVYGGTSPSSIELSTVVSGVGGFAVAGVGANNQLGWVTTSAGDVNGDGYSDVIVGQHLADTNGVSSGEAYVIYGNDFGGLNAGTGTLGDDMLTGETGPDYFVTGAGADTVLGEGGNDLIYTGPGDDIVDVPGGNNFFRLDGGTGEDTLRLSGSGETLDLASLSDLVVVGFEILDITGSGDNTVNLDTRDLRALSPTANTVTVLGDAGDTINADLQSAGFSNNGTSGGFTTYSNGVLTLVVDADMTANVQI
jgi:hypothetical protein